LDSIAAKAVLGAAAAAEKSTTPGYDGPNFSQMVSQN